MPSYLDLGLIVVVLISALLSMLRGFTREVLAIASWAAAAAAAYLFHPMLLPTVKQYISNDKGALAVAAASIFLVTLVIVITAVNTSLAGRGLAPVPVAAVGIIIGVDRLVDMVRTTVNVWGDIVAAKVITKIAPDPE